MRKVQIGYLNTHSGIMFLPEVTSEIRLNVSVAICTCTCILILHNTYYFSYFCKKNRHKYRKSFVLLTTYNITIELLLYILEPEPMHIICGLRMLYLINATSPGPLTDEPCHVAAAQVVEGPGADMPSVHSSLG